jgi:hypothetical protein
MRKHWRVALILAGLVLTVASIAIGQDSGNSTQSAPMEAQHGRGHFDPAKRTEMLTRQLDLTSDQQPKVLDILKSEQAQIEKLHSDSSLSQDDRHSKMMDIHKATSDQIRALLDSDQQKKWDEMQSQHEQWQRHHHDGQGPGAGPSSSDQK